MTARAIGAATNYSLSTSSVTDDLQVFGTPSFKGTASGAALTGGANGQTNTAWDYGTYTLTMNGVASTANYGQAYSVTTAAQMASAIANAVNSNSSAPATAAASGQNVTLTSKVAGAGSNYAWSASSATSLPGTFAQASFGSSPASGTMTGGAEAGSGLQSFWTTLYAYDALDNLLRVDQKGGTTDPAQWRTRTFTYNSLSQLLSATNPESGTISYSYDADGNVITKTDARGIAVTHGYDTLHRLTSKAFSDSTPAVYFDYDAAGGWTLDNAIGRLARLRTATNTNTSLFSYDAMGRIKRQYTNRPSIEGTAWWQTDATYALAGNLTSLLYPSGRKVTYGVDAANRLNNVTFASFGAASVNYNYWNVPATVGTTPGFYANGAPRYERFANGLEWQQTLDNRLRPATMSLAGTQALLSRQYLFEANGNLRQITDALNANKTQAFTYDQLNRLLTAVEGPSTYTAGFGQSFSVDAWGNLTAQTATKGSPPAFSAAAMANNRLSGYSYDLAGNMTNDGLHSYSYNAESMIASVDSGTSTYTYDANGMRVRKQNAANSEWTEYVYFGSEVIAEKSQAGDWSDYVYAGGQRIAKADSFEDKLRTRGTNSAASQYSGFTIANAAGHSGYVIQPGDKLYLRQYQVGGSRGGMILSFSNGANTNWNTPDQDGQQLNNDGASASWHPRRVDLSGHAGKSLQKIDFVCESSTPAGSWEIAYKDVVLVSADGTVRPIFTGQGPISTTSWGSAGVTGKSATVVHQGGIGQYPDAGTSYYHGDHLGSSRLTTGYGGWPVWQATYLPYGWEYNAQSAQPSHHYKFTGKERDTETGLDYFGKRYLSSAMGRWTSPDPKGIALRHLLNPQKLNKYSYVLNNPMSAFDPDGMEEVTITYRAFIPTSSVTVAGKTNGGDNRGFSTAANASSRTSISIRIETDPNIRPGNPIISVDSHAGQSTTIKNGQVVETATATKGLPTATGTRDANGTPIINIQQDTKNPLSPGPSALTPGISANLNVMVYQDASTTQVNGTAAQFPASELNVTRADGTTTPVVQYMPPSDASPWSLLKPDRDVNVSKPTPACHGGDKGCPQ